MKNAATVFYVFLALTVSLLGQGTAVADVITYYHTDLAGSPVAGSDVNGNIVWREAYTPYGERRLEQASSGNNRRWFTGQPHEEFSGLTYLGARHYDPMIGRFMGVDPVGPNPSRIQYGFNRYAYADNNPLDKIDPSGNEGACVTLGHCDVDIRRAPDNAKALGGIIADFTPVVGFVKGVVEAVKDPTAINVISAAVGVIPELGAVAKDALKAGSEATRVIKDSEVVVRGGTADLPAAGEIFSGAAGKTLEDAAQGVPHGQIRATTAGEIRESGGSVVHQPELTRSGVLNEKHVNVCLGSGPCPFGKVQPNPVPKAERAQ